VTTVHLVYPHGDRISAPKAIGRHLAARLSSRYDVVHHQVDDVGAIEPLPGDVLVGHPHPAPWTVFRRSAARPGWRRVLVLMPYLHVDDYHVALADPVVRRADLFLAITGRTWFDDVGASRAAHWRPKMVHVDLAVDRAEFPLVKRSFNPPGRRRFVYIGHTGRSKNTPYLSELAARLPETEFSWIGSGHRIAGLRPLGRLDFATEEARRVVAEHDFLLTVGSGDANPTTILEAMAWGLIPVCTPESGYAGHDGVVNVPLRHADRAAEVLRGLQDADAARLVELQRANLDALDRHFNWDRFATQVVDAIESDASPPLLPVTRTEALRLRALSLRQQLASVGDVRYVVRSLAQLSPPGRALLARRRRRWAERHGA
jgi:glycosyltransferase involved in cell wall biosynthesis